MRTVPLLALAAVLAVCGRDIDPPRPDRSTIRPAAYAAVIAELAVARAELLPDSAAYRDRQAGILARHGVTAAQIHAFAEAHAGNEDVMLPVYQLVRARLDSLFGPPGGVPPAGVLPSTGPPPAVVAPPETAPAATPPDTAP